ncbi:MAG: ACT domain-containing protein [Acidobacteria bacterium]|nr:ACT domain-containing protein [Acidobacteriota bacterium]
MRKVRQLTVRVPSRPGVLGEIASALWARGINIDALLASDVHKSEGSLHLIVNKPDQACQVFTERGFKVRERDVLAVTLPDRPGSLAKVAKKLGKAGINIEYAYSGGAKQKGKVKAYLAVSDLRRAIKLLR